MTFRVKFSEQGGSFRARFGETHNISDGGYERGYAEGYETGNAEGYARGHTEGVEEGYADGDAQGYERGYAEGYSNGYGEGLAARTFETWTITLADGTVVEKEVALL